MTMTGCPFPHDTQTGNYSQAWLSERTLTRRMAG